MAEVIVGHRGFGVLVQGLPKFAGVDIEESAGMLFTFCLVNDRRSIEVELEVREVLSKFPRLARVESDGYALDGFDFISNSGSGSGTRAGVYGATVAVAAGVVAAIL